MYKKLLIIAAMYFGPGHGLAQQFNSTVVDAVSGKPLAYATILIARHDLASIANEHGKFSISLDPQYNSDTIVVSMVGYHDLKETVKNFRERYWTYWTGDPQVALTAKPSELKEVIIVSDSYKEEKIGNKKGGANASFESSDTSLAWELATLMRIKENAGFIKEASFHIADSKLDSILFMVNIYKVKDGLPGETIVPEPVYVSSKIKKGAVVVDLKKYHLYVEEDFFVSITWMFNAVDKSLALNGVLAGSPVYSRLPGNEEWKKLPLMHLSFSATLLCKSQ